MFNFRIITCITQDLQEKAFSSELLPVHFEQFILNTPMDIKFQYADNEIVTVEIQNTEG